DGAVVRALSEGNGFADDRSETWDSRDRSLDVVDDVAPGDVARKLADGLEDGADLLDDVVRDVLDVFFGFGDVAYGMRDVPEEVEAADAGYRRGLRLERREMLRERRSGLRRVLRQVGHDLLLDERADLPGRLAGLAGCESDRLVVLEVGGGGSAQKERFTGEMRHTSDPTTGDHGSKVTVCENVA